MSLGAIAVRRRHGGGGGSPPPTLSPLKIGMNLADQGWSGDNIFWNEGLAAGGVWGDSLGQIPAAYLDSKLWPNQMRPSSTVIGKGLTPDPTLAPGSPRPYDVTWQGNIDSTSNWFDTISSFDNSAKHATLTPQFVLGGGTTASLRYAFSDTVNYPKNIKVMPAGVVAEFDATVKASMLAMMSGGAIRPMDQVGVNFNGGPSAGGDSDFGKAWGGGTQAAPHYKIDTANLAQLDWGQWTVGLGFDFNGFVADGSPVTNGYPVEALCRLCNDYNKDLWYNLNWNLSPAAVSAIAAMIRDKLNPGLKAYFEVANEVWNFTLTSAAGQAQLESQAGHRTSGVALVPLGFAGGDAGARLVEKTIEFMGYVSTAFAAPRTGGGAKPTLKRICAWQQMPAALVTLMLNYVPNSGTTALKDVIDCFASAPYADPYEFSDQAYTGTYTKIVGYMYPEIDNVWRRAGEVQAACAALGKEWLAYESGFSTYMPSGNLTLAQTLYRSTEMYDAQMYYWQRGEAACPNAVVNHYTFCNQITDTTGHFGLLELPWQPITRLGAPKAQATKDYANGIRKLYPLTGELIAYVGAHVGDVVGYLKRRLKGSTVVLTSTPTGALTIEDATADVLKIKVADASAFTAAGSVTWSITETDARDVDSSGSKTTTGTCTVTASTIWSPAKSNSTYDITGTGKVGTKTTRDDATLDSLMWASTARTDGYCEFTVGFNASDNSLIGFAWGSLAANLAPGDDPHSVRWQSNGDVRAGGVSIGTFPTYISTDLMDTFISPSGKLYGRKNNGSWFPAASDPIADTGGIDISAVISGSGGLYPVVTNRACGASWTARFADANLLHTKPTGAHDWTVVPDTTAPVLSSPVGTATGATTATIGATTDEGNGILYGVVTASGTVPTKAQIKAGQNAAGGAAVFAGSIAVSSTGAKTISATGLTAVTAYFAHLMHEDAAGNQSNVVSSATFTTSAAGWTPASLGAKVKLWLEADTLAGANGSAIATWPDASGNSNDATGVAGPTVIAAGLNGMKTAQTVSGAGQYFTPPTTLLSGFTQAAGITMYFNDGTDIGAVFGDFGTDALANHEPYSDGNVYDDFCTNTRRTVSGLPTLRANGFHSLGFRSKANDWRCNVDGTNFLTDGTNTVGFNTAPLLCRSAPNNMSGQVAEVVLCNDFLTDAEFQKLEGYLHWKWGLQSLLPVGHPYKSAAP